MPAVVPHLESADPTEAMLMMMMLLLLLMMMKMTLLLIIPPSRDKTLHLAEPRGKEWKGKERDKAFSTRPANDYQSFWD